MLDELDDGLVLCSDCFARFHGKDADLGAGGLVPECSDCLGSWYRDFFGKDIDAVMEAELGPRPSPAPRER